MKQIYNKIWEMAKPYYEKGRPMDIDHIEWMMEQAEIVCEKEKLDDSLLLPLVIMHDVGYGVSKHAYLEKELKQEHMILGSKIAKEILEKLKYPKKNIEKIVHDISIHDNWIYGMNEIYKNDIILGTFTDLDYTWMATPKGFFYFMNILKKSKKEMVEFLETNEKPIARPFSTETTKKLYESYLQDRRKDVIENES